MRLKGTVICFFAIGVSLLACGSPPPDPSPPANVLSNAGLFADFASRTLAPGVRPFEPKHVLWSDQSEKSRWLLLPENGVINTSDMNNWIFPVGTKAFKEFSRDGVVIETRMIERTGPGPDDYYMVAYVQTDDDLEASPAPEDGVDNARGTEHDVPSEQACIDCHQGEAGRFLGLSALLLPEDSIAELAPRMTDAPASPIDFPGTSSVADVLGYLHVNCGTCHSPLGVSWEDSKLDLRVRVEEESPEQTQVYLTSIGVAISSWRTERYTTVVVAGDPEASALLARMKLLNKERMPPIASELVDADGVDLIERWITGLPPR